MKKKSNILQPSLAAGFTEEIIPENGASSKNKNGGTKLKPAQEKNKEFIDELDNRELLKVLSEVRNGNFSVRMPIDRLGLER